MPRYETVCHTESTERRKRRSSDGCTEIYEKTSSETRVERREALDDPEKSGKFRYLRRISGWLLMIWKSINTS